MNLLSTSCALCFRSFQGRRALRCDLCSLLVCRRSDRACYAIHMAEEHG